MLDDLKQAPRAPLILGLAGAIPFLLCTALFLANTGAVGRSAEIWGSIGLSGVIFYAAIILSFLGGTRWGRAVTTHPDGPTPVVMAWSVLPAIIAWVGALISFAPFRQPEFGLAMVMFAHGAMLAWDLGSTRDGQWPRWYGALRTLLSTIAIATIGVTLWRVITLLQAGA